jgi:hypothetical protein
MTQYFSSTPNTSRNNRTTCLRTFIFIFERHESRIIQNFPPQLATRWPPSCSLHSRGSDRLCHNSNTTNITNPTLAVHQHFHNSNTFTLFFMSILCILISKCLLYTNICINKWRNFVLKLLRHDSVLIHHLQGDNKSF